MQSLEEAIRQLERRPTLHPHKGRKTQAGPARHVLLGHGRGRMYVGMRKYGFVEIELFDIGPTMKRISATKPRWWWRWDPEYNRIVSALNRYRMDKYARDITNALTTAWRC